LALTLSGGTSSLYRIEVSSNLVNWSGLATLPLTASSLQQTDTAAPYLQLRNYRALQFNDTNALTGDHLTTTNGDLIIHPINHASFVMKWNGKTIYNDPVGGATPYVGLARADLILISHAHSDHYDSNTLFAVKGANCVVIAPSIVSSSSTFPAALKPTTVTLANGGSTSAIGITIDAIPAYNISNSNHPMGQGNGYVLTIGGRRIYMSGDSEDVPAMRNLTNIDVAFVCMNLPFTMSTTNAASAVRQFGPRVVYPYHYRNGNNTFSDLNDFKRRVAQDLGIEVRLRKWY
jgi:L-ascorbate metabolism protein UlaG (beta-lactamase superfamily)